MKKLTTEDFVKKAKEIHGDKYDYSNVVYEQNSKKVCIICPEHGEFWQTPSNHYRNECPYCAGKKMDTEHFIKKAKQVHGDKYDYSKTNYIKDKIKVCIICPEHGEFWQDPYSHLNGCGCFECNGNKKLTTEMFIEKAKKIHGEKYDYSKVEYKNYNEEVIIICPEHGEFLQKPSNHLDGCGCQLCSRDSRIQKKTDSIENYIKKAKQVHGDKYDYSNINYINAKHKILIKCFKHGNFYQEAWSHLSGCGCPKCTNRVSNAENEIVDFIKKLTDDTILRNVKNIISPLELDIYIPSKKIAIEYNGLLWHSEKYKNDKNYHYNKLISCNEKGIKLIQIFEDEYKYKKDIVLSKIEHILNLSKKQKIYGRKCIIKEISYKESSCFLEKNHIQGKCASTIYIGCFFSNKLVGVMTFTKQKNNTWVLDRFASDISYQCIGVGGKLFKYFTKNYNPEKIESFADRRWTTSEVDNIYVKLGFKFDKYIKPDYSYYIPNKGLKRIHKFNLRKQNLYKKYNLPLSMTETEMTEKLNAYKIWNCGLLKYVIVKKSN